jgi:hypothetical protein
MAIRPDRRHDLSRVGGVCSGSAFHVQSRILLGRFAVLLLRFETILTTTGSVAGTVLVNSALGFVYWWVAVRLFSPASVGLAVAAGMAMALLVGLP